MSQAGRDKEVEREGKKGSNTKRFSFVICKNFIQTLRDAGNSLPQYALLLLRNRWKDECKRSAYAFIVHVVQHIHQDTLMWTSRQRRAGKQRLNREEHKTVLNIYFYECFTGS